MAEDAMKTNQDQKTSGDLVRDQLNQIASDTSATLSRLEAENFVADDLDGMAEGVNGSGNLNHISVLEQLNGEFAQDGQAPNDMSDLTDGSEPGSGDSGGTGSSPASADATGVSGDGADGSLDDDAGRVNGADCEQRVQSDAAESMTTTMVSVGSAPTGGVNAVRGGGGGGGFSLNLEGLSSVGDISLNASDGTDADSPDTLIDDVDINVEAAQDTVENTVQDVTDTVDDIVNEAGNGVDAVTNVVDGVVGSTIPGDTLDNLPGALNDPLHGAVETIAGTLDTVDGAITDATGGAAGADGLVGDATDLFGGSDGDIAVNVNRGENDPKPTIEDIESALAFFSGGEVPAPTLSVGDTPGGGDEDVDVAGIDVPDVDADAEADLLADAEDALADPLAEAGEIAGDALIVGDAPGDDGDVGADVVADLLGDAQGALADILAEAEEIAGNALTVGDAPGDGSGVDVDADADTDLMADAEDALADPLADAGEIAGDALTVGDAPGDGSGVDVDADADTDLLADAEGALADLDGVSGDDAIPTEMSGTENGSELGELWLESPDAGVSEAEEDVTLHDDDPLPDPAGSVLEGLDSVLADESGNALEGSFLG